MKTTSPQARKLLTALNSTSVGAEVKLDLPSLIPALPSKVQAMLTEAEPGKNYRLSLCWCGVLLTDVWVEVKDGQLKAEVM